MRPDGNREAKRRNGRKDTTNEKTARGIRLPVTMSEGHHKCAESVTLTRAGPVVGRGIRGRLPMG
jgi:hypothetical protein